MVSVLVNLSSLVYTFQYPLSFKNLLDYLELMCLSTRDLVLRCCADLAEQQTKAVGSPEHKLGELTLSVGYIREAGNIEVTIFQGHNLPGLDKSGILHTVFVLGPFYMALPQV